MENEPTDTTQTICYTLKNKYLGINI